MPESNADEPLLDLPAGDSLEHIDSQVQKAQAKLVEIERAREQIEKQKRELQEAQRRQEQFHEGRQAMVEQLTRSIVVIERETYEAQKRAEQLKQVHGAFSQHLDILESINPRAWEGADLAFIQKELNRALSAVDDAKAEFISSRAIVNAGVPAQEEVLDETAQGEGGASGYRMDLGQDGAFDFGYWLKAGFAFTLPLFAVGLLVVILIFMALGR